jgi:hypothetical protein
MDAQTVRMAERLLIEAVLDPERPQKHSVGEIYSSCIQDPHESVVLSFYYAMMELDLIMIFYRDLVHIHLAPFGI